MKVEWVLTRKEERVIGREHWTGEVTGERDNKCSTDCIKVIGMALGQTRNGKTLFEPPHPSQVCIRIFPRCLSLLMPECKLQIKLFYGKVINPSLACVEAKYLKRLVQDAGWSIGRCLLLHSPTGQ